MPEISIIIPQHRHSSLTQQAVKSLLECHQESHPGSLEILVIDDGSPFPELRNLHALQNRNVSLIHLPRRCGVTAAWNVGARQARGSILIFLNNDTFSTAAWMESLIAPLRERTALMTAPEFRRERELPMEYSAVLSGWCMALRAETFRGAGGFDERFRLYFSDTDLQLRLRHQSAAALAGCSPLPLKHLGHRSTKELPARSAEWRRDRNRFREKWRLE